MTGGGLLAIRADELGLRLDAVGVALDPIRACPFAFVSHAHATRAMGSACVLASPETIALARALGTPLLGARPIGWDESIEWPLEPGFGGGCVRLSLAPAGHMLGAAQLVVDHRRGRVVYTGDWSAEADGTHPAGVAVPCDELIVTSTFGLPLFRFDAESLTLGALVRFCDDRLRSGRTPVVLAHSPGPAEAIARELVASGLPVAAHDAVRRTALAYEALGVVIGPLRPHVAGHHGSAVVAPASARSADVRPRGRAAVAYASGWALLDAAVEQKRADAAFPIADQADHDALLSLVHVSGAKRVHVTYGDSRALAHVLRTRGVDAEASDLPAIDDRGSS